MSDASGAVRLWSEALLGGVLRGVWGIRASGLERVPRTGPLIVAFNHVAILDGPLVCAALAPLRRPYFLGKKELFEIPVFGRLLRAAGSIPLDRGAGDHAAMRAALGILRGGGALGLAPEGTRVKPGERRPPKPGVSFLAARSGAPVLPMRLFGTARFPRSFPLEVRCGPPLAPPSGGREEAAAFARAVMDAIYAL